MIETLKIVLAYYHAAYSSRQPNNDSAIGVLCLKLYEAKDLKNVEILGNMSDPYANIRLGGLSVAKSRVISANLNPYWNETFVGR